MDIGRLTEVGSRMNCVRWEWLVFTRMLLFGKYLEIVLGRSGVSCVLVSEVALHLVRT